MTGRPRSFEPEQVLAAAMEVFWSKGYAATGIADLEQATGLGRQSLYGAFGDKAALFARVVDFYFERVLKPLVDSLDAPGSARANLERVFDQWQSIESAQEFNGCLVGNSVSALRPDEPELADLLKRKLSMLEQALMRALRRAQRAGEVPAELNVAATASALLAIAQGLAIVARVRREPAFVRAVVDSARRLLD